MELIAALGGECQPFVADAATNGLVIAPAWLWRDPTGSYTKGFA